jgi:hypothetical protein
MKNRNIIMIIAALCVMMGACFSPWDGSDEQGNIVINVGSGGARAALAGVDEYVITLTNFGETSLYKTTNGGTADFSVQPGPWNIVVCAMGSSDASPIKEVKGYGGADVEVKARAKTDVTITVEPISIGGVTKVVSTWKGLKDVFESNLNQPEKVIITGDLSAYSSMNLSHGWNITLLPKPGENITITKNYIDAPGNSLFRVLSGCILTLGLGGMNGEITINGGGYKASNSSLAYVEGTLNMYNNVTLTNNYTTISNPQRGGAVSVYGGTFNMHGGTISGNSTVNNGGGVYVNSGSFSKDGGIIYGSNEDANSNKATQGHAVYDETKTTKSIDNTLRGNY